ncbi:hypothetical protein TNCV_615581 [Trichonephila clavipes]|nr:hypothetical protein TNCV_615581 [Trichonephila clavipes]
MVRINIFLNTLSRETNYLYNRVLKEHSPLPCGIGASDADCRRAASPLVKLVEGEVRWETPTTPRVSSEN